MTKLWLNEIGSHRSNDAEFPTIFQVAGLPVGNSCVIGRIGPNQWTITWHRRHALVEIDGKFETPQLALSAVQKQIDSEESGAQI